VVRDYSSNYSGLIHFHPQRLRDCTAQARYIDGIVVPIADDVQLASIFHWIIDWLPRLAFLGPAVRKRDVFVATSPLTAKFQRETLRLCGVDEDRIITVGNFEAIQARELLVPSNLGEVVHPGFTAAPWVMSYLRSTLGLGALRQASLAAKAGDRVYVSRRDAAHRRVTNEDELLARLADAGFREVALSSLPLVDQIATFANADSVIGLHGAGLIHFAFTPPGARLLEILPQSYAIPTLYVLAAGLGGEYLSYVTDQIVPGTHPSFDDVAMDVDDFAERCRSFLA
jgi:capsular polysaccharide biosynthesis protein